MTSSRFSILLQANHPQNCSEVLGVLFLCLSELYDTFDRWFSSGRVWIGSGSRGGLALVGRMEGEAEQEQQQPDPVHPDQGGDVYPDQGGDVYWRQLDKHFGDRADLACPDWDVNGLDVNIFHRAYLPTNRPNSMYFVPKKWDLEDDISKEYR